MDEHYYYCPKCKLTLEIGIPLIVKICPRCKCKSELKEILK